jgi:putative colanic acid biosynthesis acetyltransferase WcaF
MSEYNTFKAAKSSGIGEQRKNLKKRFLENQKKVDNALYLTTHEIGASALKLLIWNIANIVFLKNPFFIFSSIKVKLLRLFGADVGVGVRIKPCINIKYPWRLVIGDYTWIGEGVWIDNLCEVSIGKSVCISQGALLLTGTHDYTKTTFDFLAHPIILEDGVWVGAKAVVSGGVRCHSHSILGINSVAESDLEPYTIYKGNPAIPVITRNISG